jgi:alginate O-acetyltransferase complex protein AlgI
MFGFEYKENFKYPYVSTTVKEFWRRWHISLSTWLREYVYFPLGGNRKGRPRTVVNKLAVFLLCGLWHGASLNFVIWGLYYFVLIALERFVFKRVLDKLPDMVRGIGTYALVLVGWMIFYFTDTAQLAMYLRAMAGIGVPLFQSELWLVVCQYSWFPLAALAAAFPLWKGLRQEVLDRLNGVYTLWLAAVLVLSVLMIVGQSYNPFIYFRF